MSRKFQKLTRPDIRRLKQGERITEQGITAERLTDGDVRYSVNIMVDGDRIHRVIGRESEGVTRTQAENFIEAKRTEAREDRLSLPTGRKTHLTFAQAADAYVKIEEGHNGKNLKAKRRHVRDWLKPFFRDQRLDKITKFTVERHKRRRQDVGASKGTINRELSTLRHLFGQAVDQGWIRTVPCKVELFEEDEGRVIALTDEQIGELMKAAVDDEDSYCWLFVTFGFNTAMRHAEILRARFDEIDFDRARLHVPRAKAGGA